LNLESTAVVILNYNGKNWLEKFLPSVIQNSGAAKIIVADNLSTDDSLFFLKENFPTVGVIEIPSNRGFCGGYNYALKQVTSTYYVLLNSDVEVTPNWIEPSIQLLESDSNISAVQPKILSYNNRSSFEYAGAAGGFIDSLGYPFCRGRIFNEIEKDTQQYDDTRAVFWATGACMFVRADHFHKLGGFDEDFFAHMEEIDLCWRLHRLGFSVYYQAQSKVYHVGGGTLATSNPQKTYFNFRNGLSLIFKNLPGSQLIWKFPLRLFLDWVAALNFLLNGSVKDFRSIARAHGDFFKQLKKERKKRRMTSALGAKEKNKLIYRGLLIVDYFLLNKRKFKQLRF
jgi:GT2 family glycosyltransferase